MNMDKILEMTTGQIVVRDYRASEIFDNHNIDYYNKGHDKLADACQARRINPEKIINELEKLKKVSGDNEVDYNTWTLDALIEEIEFKQRRFFVDRTAEIKNFLNNLISIQRKNDSELSDVINIFNHFSSETSVHLMKERLILFPYVRKLFDAKKMKSKYMPLNYFTLDFAVAAMKDEHNNEANYIDQISEITNIFMPFGRDEGYRIAFMLFKSLKKELIRTIHLENNILFPKAIELERELS